MLYPEQAVSPEPEEALFGSPPPPSEVSKNDVRPSEHYLFRETHSPGKGSPVRRSQRIATNVDLHLSHQKCGSICSRTGVLETDDLDMTFFPSRWTVFDWLDESVPFQHNYSL